MHELAALGPLVPFSCPDALGGVSAIRAPIQMSLLIAFGTGKLTVRFGALPSVMGFFQAFSTP